MTYLKAKMEKYIRFLLNITTRKILMSSRAYGQELILKNQNVKLTGTPVYGKRQQTFAVLNPQPQ